MGLKHTVCPCYYINTMVSTKVFFWAFSGQKWIENIVKPPKTAFWTTLDPIMWLKHLPPFQPKNFQSHFFGLFSPVMDAELKITPWKTILDDLRGVQGVWDQKTSKISKLCFGHLKYWARINSIGSVRTTRPLISGHWVQHHVYW